MYLHRVPCIKPVAGIISLFRKQPRAQARRFFALLINQIGFRRSFGYIPLPARVDKLLVVAVPQPVYLQYIAGVFHTRCAPNIHTLISRLLPKAERNPANRSNLEITS